MAAGIALVFTVMRVFELDRAAGLSIAAAERLWLGLGAAFLWALAAGLCSESQRRSGYGAADARDMPLAGYERLIGPIQLFDVSAEASHGNDGSQMRLRQDNGDLVLELASGPVARFDLAGAVAVAKAGIAEKVQAGERPNRPPLTVPAKDGSNALLIVDELVFTPDGEVRISSGQFWILLGR